MDNQHDHGEGMSVIVYDRNDFYPSGESINASQQHQVIIKIFIGWWERASINFNVHIGKSGIGHIPSNAMRCDRESLISYIS